MKTMRHKFARTYLGLFASLALALAIEVHAATNILLNGSFELFTGSLPPPQWTGNFGLGLGYDGAANGRNFADLSFAGLFAAQTLQTVPGQIYHVSFAVSGNSSFPGLSIVQISWDGSVAGNTTWVSPNTPGNGLNFNWQYGSFDLAATSASTLIRFERNPTSTSAGTWLDDVWVVPIPEPSVLALLVVGSSMMLFRWSRWPKSP